MSLNSEMQTVFKDVQKQANDKLNSNNFAVSFDFMTQNALIQIPAKIKTQLDDKSYDQLDDKTKNVIKHELQSWISNSKYLTESQYVPEYVRFGSEMFKIAKVSPVINNAGVAKILAHSVGQQSTKKIEHKSVQNTRDHSYRNYRNFTTAVKSNANRMLKSSNLTIAISFMRQNSLVRFPKKYLQLLTQKSFKSLDAKMQEDIKMKLPKWIQASKYVDLRHVKTVYLGGKTETRVEPYAVLTKAGETHVLKLANKNRKVIHKENQVKGLPPKLANVYNLANKVLSSTLPSYHIQKYTGVNHSSIIRLRNMNGVQGRRNGLKDTTFKTMLLLASYPNTEVVPRRFNTKVSKLKYQAYLYHSLSRFSIDLNDIKTKVVNLVGSIKNVSAFSRKTGIHRLQIERIRSGNWTVLNMKVINIAKLLNFYHIKYNS